MQRHPQHSSPSFAPASNAPVQSKEAGERLLPCTTNTTLLAPPALSCALLFKERATMIGIETAPALWICGIRPHPRLLCKKTRSKSYLIWRV
jgi:hypothetical protein